MNFLHIRHVHSTFLPGKFKKIISSSTGMEGIPLPQALPLSEWYGFIVRYLRRLPKGEVPREFEQFFHGIAV